MLQPVRSKFRKAHKGRIHGKATRASSLNYGEFIEHFLLYFSRINFMKNHLNLLIYTLEPW